MTMPANDIVWTLLKILASIVFLAMVPLGLGLARAAGRRTPSSSSPGLGTNAPSAQAPTPAPTGARQLTRNQQLCVQFGHVVPDYARTPTHLICVRCEETWERIAEDDFDAHADQAMAIANSKTDKPDPDPFDVDENDEVSLADVALWELENDWATS